MCRVERKKEIVNKEIEIGREPYYVLGDINPLRALSYRYNLYKYRKMTMNASYGKIQKIKK